ATKKTLLVEKIECYSASNMLIKTLEFKEVKDFGNGLKRPSVIETYSSLYKGYRSIMIYAGVKARSFPDEAFTLNYLSKLGDLK
ncbi:MAG: outer membrane lipoprotein-sorting protein, partial [Chitinispirillaceae bacterium]|nr:outer membrane lipoprotein-sorting protein [Chitinispirillaceae bacterium]